MDEKRLSRLAAKTLFNGPSFAVKVDENDLKGFNAITPPPIPPPIQEPVPIRPTFFRNRRFIPTQLVPIQPFTTFRNTRVY
ncbi:unnamed protein product [Strongylus vulgaris]|uniref:Uncharacterized protein n=1 Tax=Strongylus vulgaris TaxID=40348 RepID=A0A3P7IES8_STRVU|nr:unnamed protein product [Strongylus vulgaris]